MSYTRNETLKAKQEKLLSDIRKIVGNKKFEFSSAYCGGGMPKIGSGDRPYSVITKKYLYVSCFLRMCNNADKTEYGAVIERFPIYYQRGSGSFVNKVELEDLFIEDMEKILRELKFYLWWETCVRLPKIREEYNKCLDIEQIFNKIAHIYDTEEINNYSKEFIVETKK